MNKQAAQTADNQQTFKEDISMSIVYYAKSIMDNKEDLQYIETERLKEIDNQLVNIYNEMKAGFYRSIQ